MSRNLVAIQADASKRGLGAVLIQEGSPIAYASRTMTATQERYAQIEKRTISCCICLRNRVSRSESVLACLLGSV